MIGLDWPLTRGARSLFAHAPFWSWAPRVPRRCGFRSGGCRDFPTIVLRRCAFNRCSILDTAASKTTDAARDPGSCQRRHREGADKEGTLAAMKALWRQLADPKSTNIAATRPHGWPLSRAGKAGCRLVSRRSDQGQAAPALAPVFNRVPPGFWGDGARLHIVVRRPSND